MGPKRETGGKAGRVLPFPEFSATREFLRAKMPRAKNFSVGRRDPASNDDAIQTKANTKYRFYAAKIGI
jgi:hypothetical protein